MIQVIVFRHTPSEPLGYLEQVFGEFNVPFEYQDLWETNEVIPPDATHLVFLGGPMSVNDEAEFRYLAQEKALIRQAVKKRVPVLGLCLGAQLIAAAHGAKVYRFMNETGWYPVNRVPEADGIFSTFPDSLYVFQMHNETFDIPYGGRLLCTGDRVKNQAFRLKSATGLQFHLEMTDALIADWTKDLRASRRQKILRDSKRHLAESNRFCRYVAEEFLFGKKAV
ncbi:MAG: type 1 glutamine amidotransferase [Methanoregula sp.]|nr:MAG: type 1 glutamine amidotransferase [Methanoregula sp.]